jgi:hypothetical protein
VDSPDESMESRRRRWQFANAPLHRFTGADARASAPFRRFFDLGVKKKRLPGDRGRLSLLRTAALVALVGDQRAPARRTDSTGACMCSALAKNASWPWRRSRGCSSARTCGRPALSARRAGAPRLARRTRAAVLGDDSGPRSPGPSPVQKRKIYLRKRGIRAGVSACESVERRIGTPPLPRRLSIDSSGESTCSPDPRAPSPRALPAPASRALATPASRALATPASRALATPASRARARATPGSRALATPASRALALTRFPRPRLACALATLPPAPSPRLPPAPSPRPPPAPSPRLPPAPRHACLLRPRPRLPRPRPRHTRLPRPRPRPPPAPSPRPPYAHSTRALHLRPPRALHAPSPCARPTRPRRAHVGATICHRPRARHQLAGSRISAPRPARPTSATGQRDRPARPASAAGQRARHARGRTE